MTDLATDPALARLTQECALKTEQIRQLLEALEAAEAECRMTKALLASAEASVRSLEARSRQREGLLAEVLLSDG